MILKKIFFKLMNNPVFEKTMKVKLVTTERRRNYLVLEPGYHTTKHFTKNSLTVEMKKYIIMNQPVYLGLSILELSKI